MVRFWSHVDKAGACWNWTGAILNSGYGQAKVPHSKTNILAHRMAWILTYGAIPEGIQVNHKCDNKACCNPDHLYLGTQTDNMRDMYERGRNRHLSGEQHPCAKITQHEAKVIRARRQNGETLRKIADDYSICHSNVRSIVTERTWRVE